MSFDEPVIRASHLGKCYQLYAQPQDRLKQFLWRGKRQYYREFWALRDVNFEIMPGEVVGIIGRNGSGKSTLLQLVCGTLTPTTGEVVVKGRVAALLELGAGFNPEFTGRENVFMSAAIMGLSEAEIAARYEDIVEFSGIRDFIDQPVKTYSSGMYVRLAFSVAISVDPDILVIDEALSVGDGEFSRRSFDRIMALKNAGKTILFCSHSLYQVEAISSRVMWLNQGRIEMLGEPPKVIAAYIDYLESERLPEVKASTLQQEQLEVFGLRPRAQPGVARVSKIELSVDGLCGDDLQAVSGESDVVVSVAFSSDPALPTPAIALGFESNNGQVITSVFSNEDGVEIKRDAHGFGVASVRFRQLSLLRGEYWLGVVLMCENGIHFYDAAMRVARVEITQPGLVRGFVLLPHEWE